MLVDPSVCKKLSISAVGVKRKLRRLSTVGSHELKKAAGSSSGGFFLCGLLRVLVSESSLHIIMCGLLVFGGWY
jgi:hypothetical protein